MSLLTPQQIELIVQTWKVPNENSFDNAEIILYKFFEKHQHYQTYFKKFKYTALEELRGKAGFRDHASKIMNRFSSTVDCLQTEGGIDEINSIWTELGYSHRKRSIPKQAFLDMRVVFLDVMNDLIPLTEEQRAAWEILLDYVFKFVLDKLEGA